MKNKVKTETRNNKEIHFSVGAVIEKDGKYLLMDRKIPPLGFAGLAGHIDEGETPEEALIREIKEESDLDITNHELLYEEFIEWNHCHSGNHSHYWYLYKCDFKGEMKKAAPEEQISIDWYTPEEIKKLSLEPVWEYWFKKLQII